MCFTSVLWGKCGRVLICKETHVKLGVCCIRSHQAFRSFCLNPLLLLKPFPRVRGGNMQTSAFSIWSGLWGWFREAEGFEETGQRKWLFINAHVETNIIIFSWDAPQVRCVSLGSFPKNETGFLCVCVCVCSSLWMTGSQKLLLPKINNRCAARRLLTLCSNWLQMSCDDPPRTIRGSAPRATNSQSQRSAWKRTKESGTKHTFGPWCSLESGVKTAGEWD